MPEWLKIIAGIGVFICIVAYAPMVFGKTVWPWWMPTWCYARFTLGVSVTKEEADQLGFLFDGSMNGLWYPLNGIKTLDKEYRREALFRFANHVARENGWYQPFPEYTETPKAKTTRAGAAGNAEQRQARPTQDEVVAAALRLIGVTHPRPTPEEIKQAYRRKVMQYHPDRFGADSAEVRKYAEEMTKKLNLAYEFLQATYQSATHGASR